MYHKALTTTALVFYATCLSAQEKPHFPHGDFHKIATTYSEEEQEFNVDVVPAKTFAWIKAVYAADFGEPAADNLPSTIVSLNTQLSVANN